MLSQRDSLLLTAMVGKQIESFFTSDVGKYLQARAVRVYNAAVEEFKKADPSDAKTMARIQGDMWKADAFRGWLEQGIQDGLTALNLLEGNDDGNEEDGLDPDA